eukprot:gene23599-29836_t
MSQYNNQNGNKRYREDSGSGGNGDGQYDRQPQLPRNGPFPSPQQHQQGNHYGGGGYPQQQQQGFGQGGQYGQQQYQQPQQQFGQQQGNFQQGGGGGPQGGFNGGRGFGGGRDGGGGGGGGRFSGAGAAFGGGGRGGGGDMGRGGAGGRDGGRGGGRGGGGRGGPHMGLNSNLIATIKTSDQCGDAAALLVINPSVADRDRSSFHGEMEGPERFFAGLSALRLEGSAGHKLKSDDHIVRANHFLVDGSALPECIHQYSVSIIRLRREKESTTYDEADDMCLGKVDRKHNLTVLKALRDKHPEWNLSQQGPVGVTYDGGAALYTSRPLNLPQMLESESSAQSYTEEVFWPGSNTMQFTVVLTHVRAMMLPAGHSHTTSGAEWGDKCHRQTINGLDVALFSFARWEEGLVRHDDERSDWILNGTKAFRTNGTSFPLSPAFVGLLGYYASLKACVSGLVLVADISVTCFLTGGKLVDIMASLGGYRGVGDMAEDSKSAQRNGQSQGLGTQRLTRIEEVLKGVKITLSHIKHSKKFKCFGPAASARESAFENDNGESVTVEQYYAQKCLTDPQYAAALPSGRLMHPYLPTVNVGSKKKPILIPSELVRVNEGQTRQRSMTGDISGKIIKHAAMLPNDRASYLTKTDSEGLKHALANDEDVRSFGLGDISNELMRINSTVLCPVKLQYGGNKLVEPQMTGTWNLAGNISFAQPAPTYTGKIYRYAMLVVYGGSSEPNNFANPVRTFQDLIEKESRIVGIPLERATSEPMLARGDSGQTDLGRAFTQCKGMGVRIVIVVLIKDLYNNVKYHADSQQMSTQCLQWKNVEKSPRGYHTNVLMKLNVKMGGVNHTMATRGRVAVNAPATFQTPPQSLSWIFDDLCMVVGVDIAHPDPSNPTAPSIAAVVASMDGMLGQYCAHISTCHSGEEVPGTLEASMAQLLSAFRARHDGQMPKRIVVFRDGVADNQFEEVIGMEVPAFKNALAQLGFSDDSVAISVVICQKRHHTRLLYQNREGQFENPCVGLCTDAHTAQSVSGAPLHSISSPSVLEFYLNSHLAVLGTSKPCKYSLIYDEIGFKLSELELLTYWTTHLYCRCTRSVSYATPAYYAHWAARRGKALLAGGAKPGDLTGMSDQWLQGNQQNHNTMYFI